MGETSTKKPPYPQITIKIEDYERWLNDQDASKFYSGGYTAFINPLARYFNDLYGWKHCTVPSEFVVNIDGKYWALPEWMSTAMTQVYAHEKSKNNEPLTKSDCTQMLAAIREKTATR